jgi:hypothetical protein
MTTGNIMNSYGKRAVKEPICRRAERQITELQKLREQLHLAEGLNELRRHQ